MYLNNNHNNHSFRQNLNQFFEYQMSLLKYLYLYCGPLPFFENNCIVPTTLHFHIMNFELLLEFQLYLLILTLIIERIIIRRSRGVRNFTHQCKRSYIFLVAPSIEFLKQFLYHPIENNLFHLNYCPIYHQ